MVVIEIFQIPSEVDFYEKLAILLLLQALIKKKKHFARCSRHEIFNFFNEKVELESREILGLSLVFL